MGKKSSRGNGPKPPKKTNTSGQPNRNGGGNPPPHTTSSCPNTAPQHTNGSGNYSDPPTKSWHRSFFGDANTWIALATVGGMLVAVFSAWAFVQSERADVLASRAYFNPSPPHLNQLTVINIVLENGGRHTATLGDGAIAWKWSGTENLPLPETPDYGNRTSLDDSSLGTIAEGKGITASFMPMKSPTVYGTFVGDQVDRLTSGRSTYYAFGYLKYRDDFSWLLGERTLKFCFKSNVIPDFGLIPCGLREARNYR